MSYLVVNPEDRFSRDEAQIRLVLSNKNDILNFKAC